MSSFQLEQVFASSIFFLMFIICSLSLVIYIFLCLSQNFIKLDRRIIKSLSETIIQYFYFLSFSKDNQYIFHHHIIILQKTENILMIFFLLGFYQGIHCDFSFDNNLIFHIKSFIIITDQQMIVGDKENISNNSDQLMQETLQKRGGNYQQKSFTQSEETPEMLSKQLELKVYQERRTNKQLYEKIKNKFSFFQCHLRLPLKHNEHYTILIKEYDRLLQEREYLERQWMRLEYQFSKTSKEKGQNFSFLLDILQSKKNDSKNSQEIIDRINKSVVLMKQGLNVCLTQEKDENYHYSKQTSENSSDYTLVCFQLQAMREQINEITLRYEKKLQQKEQYCKKLLTQNNDLIRRVQDFYQKSKKKHLTEIQLYEKINKLTAQLLEKDKKIEELKFSRETTKKYISKDVDESNAPLFQIFIKKKSSQTRQICVKKYDDSYVEKSLEEIESFLKQTGKEYFDNFEIVTNIYNRQSEPLSDKPSDNSFFDESRPSLPAVIGQLQNCRENHYFSSSKKQKRTRELLSTVKSKQIPATDVKQMLFIRRK